MLGEWLLSNLLSGGNKVSLRGAGFDVAEKTPCLLGAGNSG